MPREQIEITRSEKTALTLMGACLGNDLSGFNSLSLEELETMLMKAYDAGYANAKDDVSKVIARNIKWADANHA